MKRIVKAATNPHKNLDQFNSLQTIAYNVGYDLSPKENGQMVLTHQDDMLPDITVKPVAWDEGTVAYDVELKFPNINLNEDEYEDTAEYHVKQWLKVARLATQIKNFIYDPNKTYED